MGSIARGVTFASRALATGLAIPEQMGDHWMDGWAGWGALVMMVLWALLLAAVVLVVVRLVLVPVVERTERGAAPRRGDRPAANGGTTGAEPAMAVLRERYARGEIDEEEFERRAAFLREES
ncbi:MAG: SHOCT domain-containing protein [Halosimplex sp.]